VKINKKLGTVLTHSIFMFARVHGGSGMLQKVLEGQIASTVEESPTL
jgi:hypothetical protein